MSAEVFLKLKEFDSLIKMRINSLKAISEQDDRLSKLQTKLDAALLQTVKLKQEHISMQQRLFEIDQRLKLIQEQRQRVSDLGGGDAKISSYNDQINTLEEEGLEFLSSSEKNEIELKEVQEFITGLTKTIKDIQVEVSEEKAIEDQALRGITLRIQLIEDELPENFKALLKRTLALKLSHGPFTRNEAGSCYFCRYKLSRIDESEIDIQMKLKVCQQCGRIFLPYGS